MTKLLLIAFAISCIVASAVQSAEVPKDLLAAAQTARAACIEETGATEDMLEKAAKGDFAEDENLKCYFKCVLDKFTLIEDGVIQFDAMVDLIPEPMKAGATKSIGACRDTPGTDLCDQSYNFNKCVYEQNPERYFVV